MTLDQLRYFLVTGRNEHIGRAAKTLNVTPSTISHAIAALEAEFGNALFVKRGKNIFLTQSGKYLMSKAETLLSDARKIEEEFKSDHTELSGNYRLAATHFLSEHCMTPAWMDTVKQFPLLTSEIYSLRSANVVAGVAGGEYDGGLCFSPQDNAKFSKEVIYSGQLIPTVRKGHAILAHKDKKALDELSNYMHIGAKAFQGIEVCEKHPVLSEYGVNLKSTVLFDSYHVCISALSNSNFWALMPDWVISKQKNKLQAIPVPKNWDAPFEVCFVYDNRFQDSRVFDSLVSALKKYMSTH